MSDASDTDEPRDATSGPATVVGRVVARADALLVCAIGYSVTVMGFVFAFLLLARVTSWLFRAVPWSLEPNSPATAAVFFGPRLAAVALLLLGIVVTDVAVTRRLADAPRTNVRATVGWIGFATALAWVPLALVSAASVGAFLFPLVVLGAPLAAIVVLVPLGLIAVGGGIVGFYAPIGVAVEGRGLGASLRGSWPRVRDHPRLAARATAALVTGWVLGGVVLLAGLAVILIAVALLLVAVGLLIFPVGLAVSSLAVVPLTGGHVYYRLASMRA